MPVVESFEQPVGLVRPQAAERGRGRDAEVRSGISRQQTEQARFRGGQLVRRQRERRAHAPLAVVEFAEPGTLGGESPVEFTGVPGGMGAQPGRRDAHGQRQTSAAADDPRDRVTGAGAGQGREQLHRGGLGQHVQ